MARRDKQCSPETRARMAAAQKRRFAKPGERAKLSASQKQRFAAPGAREQLSLSIRESLAAKKAGKKPAPCGKDELPPIAETDPQCKLDDGPGRIPGFPAEPPK